MAKKTSGQMKTEDRNVVMKMLMDFLTEKGEEPLSYKNNAFSIPRVLEDGTETFAQITISYAREESQFDGYEAHENFELDKKVKAEKAKDAAKQRAEEAAKKKAKTEEIKRKKAAEQAAKEADREKYVG